MRILLVFALACLLFSCSKDESCNDPQSLNFGDSGDCEYVNSEQHALYFKFTATWCAPCGAWGAKRMKSDLEEHPTLLGLEAHVRDEMSNSIGDELYDHFGIRGVPTFKVNDNDNFRILDESPAVGLRTSFDIKGDIMTVNTDIQALDDLPSGEYRLAVYLVEDGHVTRQKASDHTAHPEWEYKNGSYPNYRFSNVLRQEASGSAFGSKLTTGPHDRGEVISRQDQITFDKKYKGDLYPVVALWKIESGKKVMVNAVSGKK
jgi:hypothetical protein